jgi:Tfp pilus assembly PilM family ATPase
VVVKNTFYLSYPEKKEKNVAIVDLGCKLCSITVVKNLASNFMRDIPIGTDNIVTLAKEKLNMDKKQVLDLIGKPEIQTKEFKDIANSVLANLLNELYLSFDYYETQFESGIEEIFVTGGFSRFAGINEFLSKNLGIPTSTFDALKNISISSDLQQKVRPFADVLAVSIGLALEDTS